MNDERLDRISPIDTRYLLAATAVQLRTGYLTMQAVADEAGRTLQPTLRALRRLRDAGLVDWTDGTSGTLRVLFRPVPFGGQQ